MSSPSQPCDEASLRDMTVIALCAALMFAQQVALAGLPNIELVSLLVMLFTLRFRAKALYIIYIFVLLEGLMYGFDVFWWIPYLYVWAILAGVTWLCRGFQSPWLYAVVSGVFGLAFGALCGLPYLFAGGLPMMAGKWISGIPFDLLHGVGNFVLCLTLWRPLNSLLRRFAGHLPESQA